MEINSVKQALKERLDEIDKYMGNPPPFNLLKETDMNNPIKVNKEYVRILDLEAELRRMISASEWLESKLLEAISVLNSNLEIEVKQKNMLRKSVEILQNRIKPLKTELPIYTNRIYALQSILRPMIRQNIRKE